MIHRLTRGVIPAKPHTVFEVDGQLAFEHCMTRAGFESVYTIAWHREPPHWVSAEEDLGPHPGWAEPAWDGPLRRCHFLSTDIAAGGTPFHGRKLLVDILEEEEEHLDWIETQQHLIREVGIQNYLQSAIEED